MLEHTNFEKLASVMNNASQQGKEGFVRMLWSNQSEDVQTQLKPLLTPESLQALAMPSGVNEVFG